MPVRVLIPPPLHSYTAGRSEASCAGTTLAEALGSLERTFPGIRFRIVDEQDRIRPHIRFYVGPRIATSLDEPIGKGEDVTIVCALSGG